MTPFEEFARVIENLALGEFKAAERELLNVVRRRLHRPDLPSLFRAARMESDQDWEASLASVKDSIMELNSPALTELWETIVSQWSGPTEYMLHADQAEARKKLPLFRHTSDKMLYVTIIIPIKVCNYRCSYCFLEHEKKPEVSQLELVPLMIERLGQIPRPLFVEMSPLGDIIAIPVMWPLFAKLNALPNVKTVEVWSNLSRDLDGIFQFINPTKVAIVATYHPTEFRKFNEDKDKFFRRVEILRDLVQDITVNFVASTANMPHYDELKARLDNIGVHLSVNALLGARNGDGKLYPEGYNVTERETIQTWMDNDFVATFMLNARRENVRCSAGKDHIQIDQQGNITRCEFVHERYGNILDDDPYIDTVERFCPTGGCSCKIYTGFIEPCSAEYARVGTKNHYLCHSRFGTSDQRS
ncbi:hypothetical protein MUU53_22295 [Rhizobium lemnae]|uniref:Radical SAM protein n=1 Tax=Rhizobium lemnae TaxID=1214924 RepID=A0ABV8EF59_9HYPH|nr:hypothetical protein [Rhizobium lemnae]MCJ8510592.1 hypothetical protein [Rhizobium lemnae]